METLKDELDKNSANQTQQTELTDRDVSKSEPSHFEVFEKSGIEA